ncbi:MAG: HAD family hydrolase [Bacillota bacterium]|nr:HAD family hydrolase [Bacillota bacterium]
MNFKAVVFDLDGTLLDTIEDLADSMNNVLRRFGYPIHDVEKYKYFVGDGIKNLVIRALPEESRNNDTIDACLSDMNEEYSRRWAEKTRPYDGITKLLDGLAERNIRTAILSNKPHAATLEVVKRLLPNQHFDVVYGERPPIPKKPDPAACLEIIKAMGFKAEEFLYLGDTNIDMKTANSAGMYAVGVLWGFRKADELLEGGAKKLISHPLELLELL